jgi:hypothetical protein
LSIVFLKFGIPHFDKLNATEKQLMERCIRFANVPVAALRDLKTYEPPKLKQIMEYLNLLRFERFGGGYVPPRRSPQGPKTRSPPIWRNRLGICISKLCSVDFTSGMPEVANRQQGRRRRLVGKCDTHQAINVSGARVPTIVSLGGPVAGFDPQVQGSIIHKVEALSKAAANIASLGGSF